MNSICVFAGSSVGNNTEYAQQARQLGMEIAKRGITLIYGGSKLGLMGEAANGALALGGKVIGIIPTGLVRTEVVHTGLTELIQVQDMHERKAAMNRLADGFAALPGGFGTFEEWFEVLCWSQLGIHEKPVALLNVREYYTPLIHMIEQSVQAGFASASHRQLIVVREDAASLLEEMERFCRPSFLGKWQKSN